MSTCHGCGGVVGRDCFNPSECEWIARDMQARAAAEEYTAPLVARIAELEALVSARPEELRYDQAALDEASRELHMSLLREGSSYGTKACEEMGRLFMTAYLKAARSPLAQLPSHCDKCGLLCPRMCAHSLCPMKK